MTSIQQRSDPRYGAAALGGNQMATVQAGSDCRGPSLPSRGLGRFVPDWLRGSRGLMLGAIVVVSAGLAFGWPAVVALGIAPIVLALLPCAAMCALGMCMSGKGRQAAGPQGGTADGILPGSAPLLSAQDVASTPSIRPATARESEMIS